MWRFCDIFQTPLFRDHIFFMPSRCFQYSPKGPEIIPTVPIRQILMAPKYWQLDNIANMSMHSFQLLWHLFRDQITWRHVTSCDTLYSPPALLYQLLCSSMWIVTDCGGFDPEQIVTYSMLNRPRSSHTQLLHLVQIHNKIHIIDRHFIVFNP